MSFYQSIYNNCISKGYEPLIDIVGSVSNDSNMDLILDLLDMYCDIQELLINSNLKILQQI